jgi:hypothetical protein
MGKAPGSKEAFQYQVLTRGCQTLVAKTAEVLLFMRYGKLDPASIKNLRSWPPLNKFKKRIYFLPTSFTLTSTWSRAVVSSGSFGVTR